jgi:hypothetical protein
MSWQSTLADRLPGTLPLAGYLDAVTAALAPLDFAPQRSFAAVSICRDELAQPFIAEVADRWDHPFHLGGLGGVPSLGSTGWAACLSHVPHRGGRGHLLVFGLPHVGIAPDGSLGESLRRHQDAPTATCGALAAVLASIGSGGSGQPTQSRLSDDEATRLRSLVVAELEGRDGPDAATVDLLDLTHAAARAVEREMWAQLEALAPWDQMDVAVMCGLQVHVPEGTDHILPLSARVRAGDDIHSRPLELSV